MRKPAEKQDDLKQNVDDLMNFDLGLSFTHKRARADNKTVNFEPLKHIYLDKRGTKEYRGVIANGGQVARIIRKKHGWENPAPNTNGETRGCITGLTAGSRKSLMDTLKMLDKTTLDQQNVKFITLTYDGDTEKHLKMKGKDYKKHLKNITHAMLRKYGGFGVWRFELQKRLVGHFHMIWYKAAFIDINWLSQRWNEITNGSEDHRKNGVDLQTARSWHGVDLYCSKTIGYLAKEEKCLAVIERMKEISPGRHWGVVGRSELKRHINLEDIILSQKAYILVERAIRKVNQIWKRKKDDFKGLVAIRKWQQKQMGLENLTRTIFVENKTFRKLVDWAMKEAGLTATWMRVSDEIKEGFTDGVEDFRLVGATEII